MEDTVIFLVGPTCSGKTLLGINLAKRINAEIISADSRQVFKYLNIGTAKPSPEEMQTVKHHLIDFLEPEENYNASRFENDALNIVKSLFEAGKQPLVVGGSGLYIKALIDGIFTSADTDEGYRLTLKEIRETKGDQYLYDQLKKIDPDAASKMLPQNWKRIIRALEVFHLTGNSILHHQQIYNRAIQFSSLQIGINWERKVLYKRIEDRVDQMIYSGLVEETKQLLEKGYSGYLNSLNTVGYKEIISYLKGNISLEQAVDLIKRNTRRFAKRQLTWFRKDERIKWFDLADINDFRQTADKIIMLINKTFRKNFI